MKRNNSILKANEFLRRLDGRSISNLSPEDLVYIVKAYYPKIKTKRISSCLVEVAPDKNVYRTAERLFRKAIELKQTDPRQIIYQNLERLYELIQKNKSHPFVQYPEIKDLEQRICVKLETLEKIDEELEEYYESLYKQIEKQEKLVTESTIPF